MFKKKYVIERKKMWVDSLLKIFFNKEYIELFCPISYASIQLLWKLELTFFLE